ncbi:hypothetical protein HD554DRAFT_2177094 [Boletus coccyginus]|nr:hypothetical protein HD554DRAFT_2177094 [Boletus coccyginus]
MPQLSPSLTSSVTSVNLSSLPSPQEDNSRFLMKANPKFPPSDIPTINFPSSPPTADAPVVHVDPRTVHPLQQSKHRYHPYTSPTKASIRDLHIASRSLGLSAWSDITLEDLQQGKAYFLSALSDIPHYVLENAYESKLADPNEEQIVILEGLLGMKHVTVDDMMGDEQSQRANQEDSLAELGAVDEENNYPVPDEQYIELPLESWPYQTHHFAPYSLPHQLSHSQAAIEHGQQVFKHMWPAIRRSHSPSPHLTATVQLVHPNVDINPFGNPGSNIIAVGCTQCHQMWVDLPQIPPAPPPMPASAPAPAPPPAFMSSMPALVPPKVLTPVGPTPNNPTVPAPTPTPAPRPLLDFVFIGSPCRHLALSNSGVEDPLKHFLSIATIALQPGPPYLQRFINSLFTASLLTMATAVSRYTPQTHSDDDARSIACDSNDLMVYTSPNMPFVSKPHNSKEELHARADGQFGPVDCFQWPQLFCKEYEFAVCVHQAEHHPSPDPLSWAWYHPSVDDFELLSHAAFFIGKLKLDKAVDIASLRQTAAAQYGEWKKTRGEKKDIAGWLLKSLEHNVMVLLNHPLTFCDIIIFVAQAQHYFLDIMTFLNYVHYVLPHIANPPFISLPVWSDWMGCFTTDTKVCDDLFHAGVPIWLLCHNFTVTPQTIIQKPVKFTFSDHVVCSTYSEHSKSTRPFECLYRGPGGFLCHFHSCHYYTSSVDPSSSLSAQVAPQSATTTHIGKAPTQAQTRRAAQKECARPKKGDKSGSHDKWEEMCIPKMPAPIAIWENAMKHVDKNLSRVRKGIVDQGYCIPEPALLISGQSPKHHQLFLAN